MHKNGDRLPAKMSSNKTGLNLKTRASGKVHPVNTTDSLNLKNIFSEEEKVVLGIQLLSSIREGKSKKAIDLINKGADLTQKDGAGWTALHHSANLGYDELVVQLIEHGGELNLIDTSGETPLHKASRKGHVDTMIALLAFGSNMNIANGNGQNPLELAVKGEQIKAVETLCMLGAVVMLQDWSWTMGEMSSKQEELVEILLQQHSREAAYSHNFISSDIVYVSQKSTMKLKNTKVSIINDDESTDDKYFLFVCKMKLEYCEAMESIANKNDVIIDIFEVRTWGNMRKTLKIQMNINTGMKSNESLVLVSPSGKAGRVETVQSFTEAVDESKHYSIATLMISTKKTPVVFSLAREVKPEKFAINTKADVTVTPQAEPDAKICIPKGSFDSDGELSLQVMDSKDANEDEKSGDVLMTNVIDISMSGGQQPKHEIGLKIPIHHKMGVNDEIAILATSKETPNGVEDWEVIEAVMDPSGKSATFKINHFSIYAGSSKEKIKSDLARVVSALERSVNKQKKIEFFLLTKWVNSETLLVVVEGTTLRKTESRIDTWVKMGYNRKSLQKSKECNAKYGQKFFLTFSGNLQEVSSEECFAVIFQAHRENFRIFSMCLEDSDRPYSGVLDISMETEVERNIIVKQSGFFLCCNGSKIVKKEKINTEVIVTTFDYEIFQPPPSKNKAEKEADKTVSHQTLNKLGLFKYKVSSLKTTKLKKPGYEM